MSETEAASYIGIIVVRQKCENHVIEYDVEKNSFGIGLYYFIIYDDLILTKFLQNQML